MASLGGLDFIFYLSIFYLSTILKRSLRKIKKMFSISITNNDILSLFKKSSSNDIDDLDSLPGNYSDEDYLTEGDDKKKKNGEGDDNSDEDDEDDEFDDDEDDDDDEEESY